MQVRRLVAHWSAAAHALRDPYAFAAEPAWRSLEGYLGLALRGRLYESVDGLVLRAATLRAAADRARGPEELERVRRAVVDLRRQFLRTETVLDFFGDAVNTRTTPKLAGILRGLDDLARQSLEAVLGPLGHPVPPVLTYVDKGIGASILRAGLRLWDEGSVNPVAAVKITRHNLYRPTALVHETGHQAAHILGWNDELAAVLAQELAAVGGRDVGEEWAAWASEIAADAIGFALTGYGSVAGLHDVVTGTTEEVMRHNLGDPHPISYLRVLLGVALARRAFGPGPWDGLRQSWVDAHPLQAAAPLTRPLIERSVPLLDRVAALCLERPMRAFGGKSLAQLTLPVRVSPERLGSLARDAGPALFTSAHWLSRDGLRLLAWSSLRAATEPERAVEVAREYENWILRLGAVRAAAA